MIFHYYIIISYYIWYYYIILLSLLLLLLLLYLRPSLISCLFYWVIFLSLSIPSLFVSELFYGNVLETFEILLRPILSVIYWILLFEAVLSICSRFFIMIKKASDCIYCLSVTYIFTHISSKRQKIHGLLQILGLLVELNTVSFSTCYTLTNN